MRASSLPAVVPLSALGSLSPKPLIEAAGQSVGIWRVPHQPGYLFKRYNALVACEINANDLDRLVAQPAALPLADNRLVTEATAWPTSRVIENGQTVGVVMPEAPAELIVSWRAPKVKKNADRHDRLPVDYLAKPNSYLTARGIPQQSAANRAELSAHLTRIAELFERYGIVYADWSYANAFWHPTAHTIFLIDIDGSSYRPRKHVKTLNFEDPLTPYPEPVDTYVDRYRAALLIARILTGNREMSEVLAALRVMRSPAPELLVRMLTVRTREERPSLQELANAFGRPPGVSDTGVIDWRAPKGQSTPRLGPVYNGATRPARRPARQSAAPPPAVGSAQVLPSSPDPPTSSASAGPAAPSGSPGGSNTAIGCVIVLVMIVLVVVAIVYFV
jgi:hypothetical protein